MNNSNLFFPNKAVWFIGILFPVFLLTAHFSKADTLKMMQYNLMYYALSAPDGCDVSESYLDNKDQYLREIINHVRPDIFCINELGPNPSLVSRILNNTLNVEARDYYRSCPLVYTGTLTNMLFYDSRKLSLHSYSSVPTSPRLMNIYKMYCNSPELARGDTTFITFIIAHLKAGQSDSLARYNEVKQLMSRLSQTGKADNFVFSGDLNLYDSKEPAYQHLIHYTNSLFRFYDPVNQEGKWHEERGYAAYHTQSTRSNTSGCFVGGGLDDRFDFILVSPYIYYGSKNVRAIGNSYHALGQDGNRYNGSIITPQNNTIPQNIATALYNTSDHLPVIMDLEVSARVGIAESQPLFLVHTVNPVVNNLLEISIHVEKEEIFQFEILSVEGKKLEQFKASCYPGRNQFAHPFTYSSSIYFLVITDAQQNRIVKKVVKG